MSTELSKTDARPKRAYRFGGGHANGNASMRDELGGKGASMASMVLLGLPVPPGFTISTSACLDYFKQHGIIAEDLKQEIRDALKETEKLMGRKFGDSKNPLLVSCRSGARQSMPGMMDTVLNVGLTSKTIKGLIQSTKNERFAYDSYRRLIMMYSDVVMEKAEGIEREEGQAIRDRMEKLMDAKKKKRGAKSDTELTVSDLKELCDEFKAEVKAALKKEFPDDAEQQLWSAIGAVFKSWFGKRAVAYRRIEHIPDDWGTACTVQSMVFGNMGEGSATGVAFTRNPATGENAFYGEVLFNAQGEDVVAGIRTPNPLNEESKTDQNKHLPTLQEKMPKIYQELCGIRDTLEHDSHDMLDIEFTIQEGKLWMVQYRVGKRTATAALGIALDMLNERLIDEEAAVLRLKPDQLTQLLYPILDPAAESKAKPVAQGLPAGPGGAVGQIVFTSADATKWLSEGKSAILVREETSPEDIEGMRAAAGVLTARGGMTSHAALVTRGWGKCCIVGAGMLEISPSDRTLTVGGKTYIEGTWISLNGTKGLVYAGQLPTIGAKDNPMLQEFLKIVDKHRKMGVRANADTPKDAKNAVDFGAEGIGLYRTEHMFYGEGSDEPLFLLRKMIMSANETERRKALAELEPFMKDNIKGTLEVMDGRSVTIRLLDPPLHEFVPQSKIGQEKLASALHINVDEVRKRGEGLHENNPMMGHRGVRLCITYPEIPEAQMHAILDAASELIKEGKKVKLEIMIPVTIGAQELRVMKSIVDKASEDATKKHGFKIDYAYGTMIEVPRACIRAYDMAETAEFFSFGTNDLSQMGFGFSRDDLGSFLPDYLKQGILVNDPFQTIDMRGIGELMKIAIEKGKARRPNIKIGVCGEHGGDPRSIEFFYEIGVQYVSCSPYRLPIARLAAAQAAIKAKRPSPDE